MTVRGRSSGEEVERLRRQRAVLADFGQRAARTQDLDRLLQDATALVSEAIEIDLVKILELAPGGEHMVVRAGVNWRPGVVGHATIGADSRSPAGYALKTGEPVISRDVTAEHRFEIPALLTEHGVKSMVNVVIRGEYAPFGVLEVDARERRDFDDDDIKFLQTYANLIAAAVDRLATHRQLTDAVAHRDVLLAELQHRVKNLLANIRALAHRTRNGSGDLEAFIEAFDDRLQALARTHELMTGDAGPRPGLRALVRQELSAHGVDAGERVTLGGPECALPPNVAQALGMAFHELATNASKYGALRTPGARLDVNWSVRDLGAAGRRVTIEWRERGVAMRAERGTGFGTEVIERSVPYAAGGSAALAFRDDGVECRMEFVLPREPAPHAAPGTAPDAAAE
jgi:two-component sensor histidine kinase